MSSLPHPLSPRAFLTNPGFIQTLRQGWTNANSYVDPTTGETPSIDVLQFLLLYHTYLALLGDEVLPHAQRAACLARFIAGRIQADGVLQEHDGRLNDHPAAACHVVDALGTFCHYGPKLKLESAVIEVAQAGLMRIVENHHVVRLPEGVIGRTQQLRFELRAYYWAWRLSGEAKYKDALFQLWENGIFAYRNPMAFSGILFQPSLHPDYTWNYACGAGTTTEYATNTHTPTYYNTELQGFLFVYLHGLKEKVLSPNPVWSDFCRKYLLGALRNLSRAGHTSVDLDGYGIHRVWFSGCLLETVPCEGAGVAEDIGLDPQVKSWFRWYINRFIEFVQRQPSFAESGLPAQLPYGQKITIEKQFCTLQGSRFYAQLARAMYEYHIEAITPIEPPPYVSYAWWHNWLRVSTSAYETSLIGTTSLRHLPITRHFGDPNLGCIQGGAPLATLFVGSRLLYATSNDPAGLWHAEISDVNGNLYRSCATSFADETSMSLKTSDGVLMSRDDFEAYDDPHYSPIKEMPAEVIWSKNVRPQGIRFFVHNSYAARSFDLKWGMQFPRGFYVESAAFILAVPRDMNPEVQFGENKWIPLSIATQKEQWPTALRWSDGVATATVLLKPSQSRLAGNFRVIPLAVKERSPGGENSFCPFPLYQLRLEVNVDPTLESAALSASVSI